MPVEICKLCLKWRNLRKSHLLSAGLYSLCQASDPNPLIVENGAMIHTSKQTREYLLCDSCEELLNRNGERWFIPKFARASGEFPFFDILKRHEADSVFVPPDTTVYFGSKNPEIDVSQITHFAMGIFWKAAARPWGFESGKHSKEPLIDLGPYESKLREFVLGVGPFPEEFCLVVKVTPPPLKPICIGHPFSARGKDANFHMFQLYISGIRFTLAVGKHIKKWKEVANICFQSTPEHLIVVQDFAEDLWNDLQRSLSSVKVSDRLAAKFAKRRELLFKSSQ
jgi:hypothetical protein